MLTITSSPKVRSAVASFPSPFRRQTKPADDSASALMRSRLSTKSLSSGLSSGALSSAMLILARWYFDIGLLLDSDHHSHQREQQQQASGNHGQPIQARETGIGFMRWRG